MKTKELIYAEIDSFNENSLNDLNELYALIKQFVQSKQKLGHQKPSFMSKLQQIQIDAPADFSANFNQYANGEKHAKTNID